MPFLVQIVFFLELAGNNIEGEFLPRVCLQESTAYAPEYLLKRKIGIEAGANERGVADRTYYALGPRMRPVGYCGRDTNVVASASGQQQRLEARQQCHEESCALAMAQGG